jgi:hypothetical protein
MKEFKKIKQIAKVIEEVRDLVKQLSNELDTEGIDWASAEFVTLDKEDIKHFKDHNGETEEYFVKEWTGYSKDDFYGYLYFKTDIPEQYVRVYYHM